MNRTPDFLMIDLFCGAGGTTTGAQASGVCFVIGAVNHDKLAIESHAVNHPDTLHFTEDIRTLDLSELVLHTAKMRKRYPAAKLVLWASLECTNHSKAKGGRPRDADSRTLAEHLPRYVTALNPDFIKIENVEEFMAWGDLDERGRPVSRNAGKEYQRWVNEICSMGYNYQWRFLNSADFGAYTSRKRYFGAFSKPGLCVEWPQPTHAKKPGIFGGMPWRPVREMLQLSDVGRSIFTRKKPLVDKTLRRIIGGVKKFHSEKMVMTCNTPGYCSPLSGPLGTITTAGHKALITPMLVEYYGNGKCHEVNKPLGVITTNDRNALLSISWADYNYGSETTGFSLEEPCRTITTTPKVGVATAFLVNPQYKNNGSSINKSCPTIIASQRSNPLGLAIAMYGAPVQIKEGDSDTMMELKALCQSLGIADIFHRMLSVAELKRIQGFPENYYLAGSDEHKKKFIGNAVVPTVVAAWFQAYRANHN